MHYVLDDPRANEESIYFSKETDSKLSLQRKKEERRRDKERNSRVFLDRFHPYLRYRRTCEDLRWRKSAATREEEEEEAFAPF